MKLGKKKEPPVADSRCSVAVPQTGNSKHPFTHLSSYIPSGNNELQLYSSLREGVPIIDAAIYKLVRLLGSMKVHCDGNREAEKRLEDFLETVNVSGTRQGIDAFIGTYFEQLLTCGTAVGEMVVNAGRFSHLYNADLKGVKLKEGKSPLDVQVLTDNGLGSFTPVPYPSLVLVSALNPQPGKLYGTSILKGLPFVSDILLKIYNTLGVNWERVGNVRFAVTYKPQNDAVDMAYAKERAEQIASEWSKTMQPGAGVRDFVAVGDVSIQVIGADNQILDSEVPVRQMLEQIVAKLGVPPFLLGLSWSSTERMSYQQADILTSEIEAYRRLLTPVIGRIAGLWLTLNGYSCEPTVEWEAITLQDITEEARGRLYNAQADQIIQAMGGEKHE